MSRFENLEFESVSKDSDLKQRRVQVSDELRCLTEAAAAFERGQFELALRWFGRVLEFSPSNLDAWTGQVRALIEMGHYSDANVWANKALEKFPQSPNLLAAKAVALARSGELDAALAFSDEALAQPGDSSYVWLARADVLLARRGRNVDPCFDRALQISPGDWLVRWIGARIRAYWKQYAAALKLVQEAAALAPDRFMLWLLAGQCQKEVGLHTAAVTSFQQALALNPRCHEAEVELASIRHSGLFARAFGWIRGGFRA